MQVRILGAHQGESRDIRYISILIDGRLAIDAGGLTTTLSLDEQHAIESILITHQHYDHIKDLPMFAHNLWEAKDIHIHCTQQTQQLLQRHIFNDQIWPNMITNTPAGHGLVFHTVKPGRRFELLGYTILPVPMVHTVPTVGYLIERDGKSIFYTADTRGEGEQPWMELRPDLLIIETTMSNKADAAAERFKHHTPSSLGRHLRAFHARQGYYPRIVCVHMNPHHDDQVRKELAALAQELGVEITPAHEGLVIEL
jgi:ribonuclease BN (tRNA processing enzyme)